MNNSTFEKRLFTATRLSATFLPTLALAGILIGNWASFLGFFLVFGGTFLVEVIMKLVGIPIKMSNEDLQKAFFLTPDQSMVLYALQHFIFIPAVLFAVAHSDSHLTIVGALFSAGATLASIGALAAHEFMHKRGPVPQALAFSIYATVLYSHFSMAHVQGHHKYVALESDWQTAKYREPYYLFFIRAVKGSFNFVWQNETKRMQRFNRSVYSLKNKVIFGMFVQLLIVTTVFLSLGAVATAFYLAMSFICIFFIEAVNYISHYGLRRSLDQQGRPEPISDAHSWNCLNKVSNWFLFETAQHTHHHMPHREKTYGEGETLPPIVGGIPTLILCSLVPPIFFAQMDTVIFSSERVAPLILKSAGQRQI